MGISWNCGTTDRTISSVTWNGQALTEVKTQLGYNTSNPRYSAIYKLVAPASGVTANVVVTFSGGVSNGAIAGAANFSNVDQTTPLGTAVGAGSADNGTALTVGLTGLAGTELIFDNAFAGSSSDSTTLTAGANQAPLWSVNGYSRLQHQFQHHRRRQYRTGFHQLRDNELDRELVRSVGHSSRPHQAGGQRTDSSHLQRGRASGPADQQLHDGQGHARCGGHSPVPVQHDVRRPV